MVTGIAALGVRVGAGLLALTAAASCLAQAPLCTLPQNLQPPAARTPDYRNLDKPYDYLALVLSWSPEHCGSQNEQVRRTKHAFQCVDNRFEWVVHGLWPQNRSAASNQDHPRHCALSPSLPVPLLRKHLCTVPGADLMQNEWQAHGTCGWKSATAYFDTIETALGTLKRPDFSAMTGTAGSKPNTFVSVRAGDVKRAFLSANPTTLKAEQLRVSVASGNRLKEIWVCLAKDLRPIACPPGGTPDSQAIRVRSPL